MDFQWHVIYTRYTPLFENAPISLRIVNHLNSLVRCHGRHAETRENECTARVARCGARGTRCGGHKCLRCVCDWEGRETNANSGETGEKWRQTHAEWIMTFGYRGRTDIQKVMWKDGEMNNGVTWNGFHGHFSSPRVTAHSNFNLTTQARKRFPYSNQHLNFKWQHGICHGANHLP